MIRILNTRQVKALDAFTIQEEAIPSIALMERACRAFMVWFTERFNALNKVSVVCGTGNNGGDGLGIARMLKDWGYPVNVWIVRGRVNESDDFKLNLARLKEVKVEIRDIVSEADQNLFTDCDILIDAIFGSGLSRPAEGIYAQVIHGINKTKAVRVAVDLPSGLLADQHVSGAIVQAAYTVSFQLPKLAFFLPQYRPFVGEWTLVNIGLNKGFIQDAPTPYFLTSLKGVKKLLKTRSKFDHKGTFGHALLLAGSLGKMGAAILSSRAVLRAGAGLLTVHIPRCGYTIMQTAVPEAMVSLDSEESFLAGFPAPLSYDAIGIGPGLGQSAETVNVLRRVLETVSRPVVIDADGLNILAAHREMLHLIPPGSILTPHPKEFERLVGEWSDDFERLEKQRALAAQLKSIVVVKGAYTAIAAPDENVYFNATGNPGMATGGSGDVLTGILTGLLAQQYTSLHAAIVGVYIHGLSGDLANVEMSEESLIASDLVTFLPAAFRQLRR